jgi:tRNA dimethylallyltransferase
MVENQGWLEEVQQLLRQGFKKDDPGFRAHGYRAMAEVIEGVRSKEDAIHATFIEVRQYAKRQRTWLRKETSVRLISCNKDEELIERAYSAVGNS